MSQRINYMQQSPEFFKKINELSNAEKESSIEEKILDLVHIRASQMNGCAFCLDMYVKQARIKGERELRLYHISTWRESTLLSARERAALEWTEILTKLLEQGVPDEIYYRVRGQLSEKCIVERIEEVNDMYSCPRQYLMTKCGYIVVGIMRETC